MIKTYKIFIGNREYTDYYYVDTNTLKKEKLMLNPIKCKFLNQDIFTYEKYSINTLHSSIQKSEHIPGVLVLQTKNTYGKIKNKFLYKCIPDDKRLPIFLIPYSINYGFNKIVNNKYITFKYKSWVNKFPIGTISQTIGDVSILTNFYEYNLYCKSLYASITYFKKEAMKKLREKSSKYFIEQIQKKYNPEIRHNVNVFAIDPKNSKDYDDAFSIQKKEKTTIISIYIANVAFWLDIMDLWSSFSKRIATIYLPDRKRPMLPTMLSDALCSLIQGQIRYALTLDLEFDNETYEFIDYKFVNTSIILKKNFIF
jgi:exoribonuclease R